MKRLAGFVPFVFALVLSALASAQVAPVTRAPAIAPATAILAHNGMVVAQESRAASIGVEILDRGGNAVDAAVAVGFALAVTYPRAGNLGGGGFMLIHLAKNRTWRAATPPSTTARPRRQRRRATMFLDAAGQSRSEKVAR